MVSLGIFFRGSFRQNHVPWGRLSLWKWVPEIYPGVKAAGAYGWRPTTLVVPNVRMIRGLNLPGTPRATSACRGTPLLYLVVLSHRCYHFSMLFSLSWCCISLFVVAHVTVSGGLRACVHMCVCCGLTTLPTLTLYLRQMLLHSEWSPWYPLQFPRHALRKEPFPGSLTTFFVLPSDVFNITNLDIQRKVTVRACPVGRFALHIRSLDAFHLFLSISLSLHYSLNIW